MDLDEAGGSVTKHSQEAQSICPCVSIPMLAQIRRSDRTKKLSTCWNEEAAFLPHPPRSAKKKILEDPREARDP